MYAPNGQDIVRIKDCPLLDKIHEKIVDTVSGALSYLSSSHELDIERIGIRASHRTKDVEVALWTTPGGLSPSAGCARAGRCHGRHKHRARDGKGTEQSPTYCAGVERLSGAGSWSELIGDECMRVSAPSFFQVNTKGAEKLVELILSALDVRDVVDPPRAGLAPDVVKQLSEQSARAIAYVSCDPATLARDLRRFDDAGTFKPVSVTPVDLPPNVSCGECSIACSQDSRQSYPRKSRV